uniref:Uncharacterized protein n=1 Tax=Pyricularia oryzae (strain P131) TaxID=1143193 RepID=L7ISG4_PYRO1
MSSIVATARAGGLSVVARGRSTSNQLLACRFLKNCCNRTPVRHGNCAATCFPPLVRGFCHACLDL